MASTNLSFFTAQGEYDDRACYCYCNCHHTSFSFSYLVGQAQEMIQTCWNTAYYTPPGWATSAGKSSKHRLRRPQQTLQQRKAIVLAAIENGYITRREICSHSDLCMTSVRNTLALLYYDGQIQIAGKVPGKGAGLQIAWELSAAA